MENSVNVVSKCLQKSFATSRLWSFSRLQRLSGVVVAAGIRRNLIKPEAAAMGKRGGGGKGPFSASLPPVGLSRSRKWTIGTLFITPASQMMRDTHSVFTKNRRKGEIKNWNHFLSQQGRRSNATTGELELMCQKGEFIILLPDFSF